MCNQKDFSDFAACLKSYIPYVKSRVLAFCNNDGEFEDYLQEGLLGLLEASETFEAERNVSFLTYAKVCIDNRLKNFKRGINVKRNVPHNSVFNINDIEEIKTDETPETIVIDRFEVDLLKQKAKLHLSSMEYRVFCYYICGYSYSEIAKKLSGTEKSVDNAIQRIKRKLKSKQ